MNVIRELNGYRVLYEPHNLRAMKNPNWKGYVYEHIAVAERSLGRPLKDNEVVHHLDGNTRNNRSANLLVLERSQHAKLHVWINSGAPGAEMLREKGVNSLKAAFEKPSFCEVCKRTLQLKQIKYCSDACSKLSSHKVLRPTKEKLAEDINKMSICAVGRKYCVSDNTIRKWMKSYGLTKKRSTMSQVGGTLPKGAETTGGVQSP